MDNFIIVALVLPIIIAMWIGIAVLGAMAYNFIMRQIKEIE